MTICLQTRMPANDARIIKKDKPQYTQTFTIIVSQMFIHVDFRRIRAYFGSNKTLNGPDWKC